MYNRYKNLILAILLLYTNCSFAYYTRIKDIGTIEGVRDNVLVGRGLVVGLNNTGDNLRNSAFTQRELVNLLEKLGINIQGADLRTRNSAAVIVTATLPAFMSQGGRIDVSVSAIGDSKSLEGGMLVATPLLGANDKVYAVAQGNIEIPGITYISPDVRTKTSSVATKGVIHGGAIVEAELGFDLSQMDSLKILLHSPDFTTACAIADSINNNIPGQIARAIDPATVSFILPKTPDINVIELVSTIEQLTVKPDNLAKIVVNSDTGTIVMGASVKIRPVAVAHGNLLIDIANGMEKKLIFTSEKNRDNINKGVDQLRGSHLKELESSVSLSELVAGLNALGVYPKDIITILRDIHSVGALDAKIVEVK